MTADQWQRVKAIVAEADGLRAADRAAFVAEACRGDAAVRAEVLSLLASMAAVGDRFDVPAVDLDGARTAVNAAMHGRRLDPDDAATMIGRRIGPYEIQRELGSGGMGAVYLAARADNEFTRHVALKVIKRGMDTDAIIRRFRAERQILAELNHPHIARLLDGGSTPEGLPYLVLEYVDGQPITTYCDGYRLSIAQRVRLFRAVCDAVSHAHQSLVVHRDIKPSNVLVTRDGEPKLLDFGLATILSADTAAEPETRSISGWMTPEFASPEQARGGRITTASDIYSLGVLLYELLCGRRPFHRYTADDSASLRTPPDIDPVKPSAAVFRGPRVEPAGTRAPGNTPAVIAAARATQPERLRRILRGDLDTITLKALQRQPERRYAVAQELSEDLRRYLARLPVSARRDTFTYHATRFVRRHTAAAVAAGLVVATLVASTIVTTAQARIARRERALAEQRFTDVRHLATTLLFDFHDAIATLPGATAARALVLRTAQEYLDSLAQQAGTDRELRAELSTAYLRLGDVLGRPSASRVGDTDGALRNYQQALALRRQLVSEDPGNPEYRHQTAIALVRMGPIFQVRGDPRRAVASTREAMQILDRLAAEAPTAEVRRNAFRAPFYLGDALQDLGDYAGAEAMYKKALAIAGTARADPPEADYRHRLAVVDERLGILLMTRGAPGPALERFRDALTNETAMSAAEPGNAEYTRMVANGYFHVGRALAALRSYADALAAERHALQVYERLARADPDNASPRKDIGGCSEQIAETLLAAGAVAQARDMAEHAVTIRRELADRDRGNVEYHDDLSNGLTLLGETLLASRRTHAAIVALEEARAIADPIAAGHPEQATYTRGLAQLYVDLGEAYQQSAAAAPHGAAAWAEARRAYGTALDLWRALARRQALWTDETSKADDVTRRIAICDRVLARRSPR